MFLIDNVAMAVLWRLQHGRGNHEGLRVKQPRRQAHRNDMEVLVEHRDALELGLRVQVDQLHLLLLVLRGQSGELEVFEGLHGIPRRRFGDDHRPIEALGQIIQDPAHRVYVVRRQLVYGADEIRLDDHVFAGLQLGLKILIDGHQGVVYVLAAVVSVCQRHCRPALQPWERLWLPPIAMIRRPPPAACARSGRRLAGGWCLLGRRDAATQQRRGSGQLKQTPARKAFSHDVCLLITDSFCAHAEILNR